jgi:hypothetical protein
MVSEAELNKLILARVHRVLHYAELAIPSDKYPLFRTLTLDEFGHSGLRHDVAELLPKDGQSGK